MNLRLPDRIVPSPDGSLFLAWETSRGLVELEIENDGRTTWVFPEGIHIQDLLVDMEWE